METFKNSRVAILDKNPKVCEALIEVMRSWELCVEVFTHPAAALENIMENGCDIILLDVFTSDLCDLDLMAQLGNDKKIIVMTESADKDTAIRALKFGAFDLLEKPLNSELLHHSVLTALKALENERTSERLMEDLQKSRSQLVVQKLRLEKLNGQLLDTNRALSVFAQNVERERTEIERVIVVKLKNLLVPVVSMMKGDENVHGFESSFDLLIMQIEDLASGFCMDSNFETALSSTEMRIAYLVKYGISTEEIARQLYISENTVRTHRKNIRRKLNINARYSLRNFLNSKSAIRKQVQSDKVHMC